jgi:hypothetical protein
MTKFEKKLHYWIRIEIFPDSHRVDKNEREFVLIRRRIIFFGLIRLPLIPIVKLDS